MKETVTIPKETYEHLVKLAIYVQNWHPDYVECKHCGHYHPEHCICLECGKSNCD